MDVWLLFILLGGLSFTVYGMTEISQHLEKLEGGRIERILKKVTSNPVKSLAVGTGITVAIQSSSALAEVLVGLVNSGIMELGQTIGILMGSNIGTAFTSWITALGGSSVCVPLTCIFAVLGISFKTFLKNNKLRDTGTILFSFAIMFTGFLMMQYIFSQNGASVLRDRTELFSFNPLVCLLAGMLVTALIQSSSASVALLQAVSFSGCLSFSAAIPVIMGQNIGTCISSVVSSRDAGKNARRVSAVHLYFNLIGTAVICVLLFILGSFFDLKLESQKVNMVDIAFIHTIFNMFTSIVLIPFSSKLEKLAVMTIKGEDEPESEEKVAFIDERLLDAPSFAITECRSFTEKMAQITLGSFRNSVENMVKFDEKAVEKILEEEDLVDEYEDKLGTYLLKLSGCSLTNEDAALVSKLLHCIGDIERISDHAASIAKISREMHEKKLRFSHAAQIETEILETAVSDILEMSVTAFITNDAELARRVEPLEEVINGLRMELKNRHLRRLQQDKCTMELGFIFSDLLTNLERVSDHCSNIAVCLIQLRDDKFDTHEYITNLKENDKEFQEMRFQYVEKYALPD